MNFGHTHKKRKHFIISCLPALVFLILTFRIDVSDSLFSVVVRDINVEVETLSDNTIRFQGAFHHTPVCKIGRVLLNVKKIDNSQYEISGLKGSYSYTITCITATQRAVFRAMTSLRTSFSF